MGIANVMITVGARTADAVSEFGKLNRAVGDSMTRSQRWGAAMKRAAIPAGIALTAMAAAGLDAAKAAAEDESAQVKLAGQLTRTTRASREAIARNEEWISSLSQATGVADDELRPALGKLASATHDLGKGQDALKLALDLSAQSGKPLEATSKALAAAFDGKTKSLAKLVPGLNQATLKGGDMGKIMAELGRKTGGAAAEAANTAEGRFRRLSVSMQETKESIGAALLPVMEKLLSIIQPIVSWLQRHTDIAVALGAAAAGLAAGVLVVNGVMAAWSAITRVVAAAQLVLNAVLSANPIGIVVLAIAGLTAALILAWRSSDTFRQVVQQVWAAVQGAITTAWNIIRPVFAAIGDAIRLVQALLAGDWSRAWEAAKSLVGNMVQAIGGYVAAIPGAILGKLADIGAAALRIGQRVLDKIGDGIGNLATWIGGKIGDLAEGLGSLPGKVAKAAAGIGKDILENIGSAFSSFGSTLWGWISGAVSGIAGKIWDSIKGKLNALIRNVWPNVPGLPGPPQLGRSLGAGPRALAFSTPATTSWGGGLTINVSGAIDPEGTARAIREALVAHERRQGRL